MNSTIGHLETCKTIAIYAYMLLLAVTAGLFNSVAALVLIPVLGTALTVLAYNHACQTDERAEDQNIALAYF